MILTPTQKLLFTQRWQDLCAQEALANLEKQPNDPLHGAGLPQLLGRPPLDDPRLQARLDPAILRLTARLAYQAMVKVPETGKTEKSFTRIIQQTNEPYMQFIDRLRDALDKQIDNADAKEALLLKLAVENANVDCKRVLQTLPQGAGIIQMIEVCNRVGSILHQTEALAGAFAAAVNVTNSKCFRCGASSHFRQQCPMKPERDINALAPHPCPRCHKGRHYVNQCRSRFDKGRNPLPRSSKSGNGRHSAPWGRAPTQIPPPATPGNAPQPSCNPSSAWTTSAPVPQEVPEWMSPQ